ncbi:MAG: hypothetical protein U1E06_19455 [Tabrizicola sp.]|uniref:hypothetical protein n=1 Tax=Tabrizicola sp. TaxID=2005166 RepID=UPI002735C3D9|nr:hypothetical protein [Tabrizicola sp.]MDP3262273.1 hypothetical protein [Tabrizicola sp.]MDP3647980.1 hypothetical protein [Paracoccaceae bacterium]MDZ4068985.1 hypothetical protein [Tabrizicola sp.]
MTNEVKDQLVQDHAELYDTLVARRYFAKFDRITGHMGRVAAELETEGRLSRTEARVLGNHLRAVAATFRALSNKYLMTGRGETAPRLTIDRHESGFPVAQELMTMAVDAQQAARHLAGMPSETELKDRMVRQIVGDLTIPTALQFALSQRYYYEALAAGGMFWARNDPDAQWIGNVGERRHYLVHWAVWDSQVNLPVVYLMDLEDSGKKPLPTDEYRWPQVQQALMAQSVGGLKLLTIATGFDKDFPDLHPRRLRRVILGPMYSASFTLQSGPIAAVLENAKAPEGQDWALVWTLEELVSDREEEVKDGWFSTWLRQVYKLDPVAGAELGATRQDRMIILPERPYQVLVEQDPKGLRGLRKFVVGAGGRLIPTL